MQEIRVDLNQDSLVAGWTLSAFIGDRSVTDHVLRVRMIALRGYIPSQNRNYLILANQRAYTVGNSLSRSLYNLPPQVLADAIKAYLTDAAPELTAGEGYTSVVESDLDTAESLSASLPAFLSIGGKMFRLNPEAESNVQVKMLEKARKAAVAAIVTQRDAMIATAKREAEIVRRQAQSEREAVEHLRAEILRERGNQFIIPEWLEGQPVIRNGGHLAVRLKFIYQPVEYKIDEFEFPVRDEEWDAADIHEGNYRWTARDAVPVTSYFWLQFELRTGIYSLERAYIDSQSSPLPHASHSGFCCAPQGLPERINSAEALSRVVRAVQRTFTVVNLGSLLTRMDQWSDAVKASMPPNLRDWLHEFQVEVNHLDPTKYGATEIVTEPANQIWEARGR